MCLITNFETEFLRLFPNGVITAMEALKLAIETNLQSSSLSDVVKRKLYPISTEMINFLTGEDLEEKRVLTVGSSGDQVFEYAFRGSKDITVMDANPLTLFYIELKYAALKSLTWQEFNNYFRFGNDFFSKAIYVEKIRPSIKNEFVRNFWDKAYDEFFLLKRDMNRNNNPFIDMFIDTSGTYPNYFASEENYNKTKEKIENASVKFYCLDFSQFHECAEGEYDLIDLSNIVDYVNSDDYWGEVSKLYPFLSLNGMFKFGAFFYDMAPYVFMGKQARHSYQESSLDISFFLWDNDLERYKATHPGYYNGVFCNWDEIATFKDDLLYKHADWVSRIGFSSPAALIAKTYLFSTEIGDGFLQGVDFTGKRILTVGSSGDQVIEYTLRGSTDITLMDANVITPFFCELKFAALKALNRTEFMKFFKVGESYDAIGDNSCFMNLEIYMKKIRPLIENEKVKKYWDYVLNKSKSYVLKQFHFNSGSSLGLPAYLNSDENYKKAREALNLTKVKFHHADIIDFSKYADGEYDMIDLSNIYRYFEGNEQKYWDSIDLLYPYLTSNGILKIEYGERGEQKYDFMGKSTEEIPYGDSNFVQVVWYNDLEKYRKRKALDMLGQVVSESTTGRGGRM